MFSSILVPVDGSPSSQRALQQAIKLARALGSTLTIITIAPPAPRLMRVAGADPHAIRDTAEQWAAQVDVAAATSLPDGLTVRMVHRSGHPGAELTRELETGNYDLVVLGTRGRGAVRAGIFGSLHGAVRFHSRVPILSIPASQEPTSA